MRDFLLKFEEICLCNGNEFFWQRDSASVIGDQFPPEEVSVCNQFGYYGSISWPKSQESFIGDEFGESLGAGQAPPGFWKAPALPRKFPELPRKFFGDFPGSSLSLTVELNSNPEVPRKFPRLLRKFPGLPRKFPDFLSLLFGDAPKERRRGRAEKRLSKRVFLESPFLLCPLKVCC